MSKWDLSPLFPSYDSEAFKQSIDTIESLTEEAKSFARELPEKRGTVQVIERYLDLVRKLRRTFVKTQGYVNLRLATDATDEESQAWMDRLQRYASETVSLDAAFSKWLGGVDDLEDVIEANDSLKPFRYYLLRKKDKAQYLLSEREESLVAKLSQTGSNAWSQLQGLLTSTLEIEFEGETLTLPEVRNKAFSRDAAERQNAYDAEIAAYEKIEQSVASALNAIKGEVNEIVKWRGYESALDQAVHDSRMQRKTLDALLASMREHLPMFRKYLRKKAALLGHEGGLPFYDLFAPIGQSERTFTIDEAMDYVIENFATFSDDLADLARRARDEDWIDFTPRKGKRGGAFCFNIHPIGQSRILTNFKGSFSNVITLAHELGHAYHGDRIFNEDILNASYTMPVAETASTLSETIVKNAALKEASGDEKRFILEQSLTGTTQVIVDILSRFIFERSVFEHREKGPLSARQLKELMMSAQKEAYGDGLADDCLHPYAWLNKPHYYRSGLSYYNFPYAFGLLFAKGIYALYLEEGQSFVGKIDALLQETGKRDVEDVAKLIGIDVSEQAFWDKSFEVIEKEIEQFLSLAE